jgi:hypothetical protein
LKRFLVFSFLLLIFSNAHGGINVSKKFDATMPKSDLNQQWVAPFTKIEKLNRLVELMETFIVLFSDNPGYTKEVETAKAMVLYFKEIKPFLKEDESWEENMRRIEGELLPSSE